MNVKQIATTVCALSAAMTESSYAVSNDNFGGFFVAAGGGYNGIRTRLDGTSNVDGSVLFNKKRFNHTGIGGGIVGWGYQCHCIYLGLEVEGMFNNAEQTLLKDNTFSQERFHSRNTFKYGGGFRFGFRQSYWHMIDILFFGRLGCQAEKWTFRYRITDAGLPGGKFSKSSHINRLNYVPGLGIEVKVWNKFSVRADVRHVPNFFKKLHIGSFTGGGAVAKFEDSRERFRVTQNSFLFTVVYHI